MVARVVSLFSLALLGGGCQPESGWVVDGVDGKSRSALVEDARFTVLLFVTTDCPIANSYAPEMRRIHADYSSQGVGFQLVYADGALDAGEVTEHLDSFEHGIPALLDPDHLLVDRTGATMTPEAAVLSPEGELLYLGRIDDRFVDYGKQRAEPTTRDLRLTLDALLAGEEPPTARSKAVGCFIPDVE